MLLINAKNVEDNQYIILKKLNFCTQPYSSRKLETEVDIDNLNCP